MKFERLDAARGFSALYVCVGHIVLANPVSTFLCFPFRFGQEAVMMFFIMSGFVISWSTLKNDVFSESWMRYFFKRFIRIYSVWAVAVLAMFAMASIASGEFVLESHEKLLFNVFMLQDFSSGKPFVICEPIYGNTPLWSLHYEWWFYMLFPIVCLVPNLHHRKHLVGVFALVNGVLYAVFPNPISRIFLYFGVWWIGVHSAAITRQRGFIEFRDVIVPICYVALSALPLIVLCVSWGQRHSELSLGIHPFLETRHLLTSIVLVVFAFAWRYLGWVGFDWTIGLFAFVAPISFSLYIIHYNSIVHAEYLKAIESPILQFFLYCLNTIFFCVLVEVYIYPKVRLYFFPPLGSLKR